MTMPVLSANTHKHTPSLMKHHFTCTGGVCCCDLEIRPARNSCHTVPVCLTLLVNKKKKKIKIKKIVLHLLRLMMFDFDTLMPPDPFPARICCCLAAVASLSRVVLPSQMLVRDGSLCTASALLPVGHEICWACVSSSGSGFFCAQISARSEGSRLCQLPTAATDGSKIRSSPSSDKERCLYGAASFSQEGCCRSKLRVLHSAAILKKQLKFLSEFCSAGTAAVRAGISIKSCLFVNSVTCPGANPFPKSHPVPQQ